MWTAKFRDEVEQLIRVSAGNNFKIRYFEPVKGGDINSVFRISGEDGSAYFIKLNKSQLFPDLFEKEALGLNLIASTQAIKTPHIMAYGKETEHVFLILEWIDIDFFTPASMFDLGARLAKMHQTRNTEYGLFTANFMGSLFQDNATDKDWLSFFLLRRLEPQLELAKEKKLLTHQDLTDFQKIYQFVESIYENEKPSLLHGDLWSGNAVVNKLQQPILIDPATYFGHREVDIAMTKLFGGFNQTFYDAYHETLPLKRGWQERCDIWNLYPLLIHLNLFGVSYLSQIRSVFKKYL